MTSLNPETPPALYEHCCKVYKVMLSEAMALPVVDGVGDSESTANIEDTVMIWEGMFTKLITVQCHLAVPEYSRVRSALLRMGCVKQLRRGGGGSPSQYELCFEPTFERFKNQLETKVPQQTKESQVDQIIQALNTRVTELEDWQTNINEALADLLGTERAS